MKKSQQSEVFTAHIDTIKPYWRNPRDINGQAVRLVSESIKEFGYLQPIVVDMDNTIIIGHTRYNALRRLGTEEVQCIKVDLPPTKVKDLRLIDNRTHEYNEWDTSMLLTELEGFTIDENILEMFPEAEYISDPGWDSESIHEHEFEVTGQLEDTTAEATFVCPSCFFEWTQEVSRFEVIAGMVLRAEK